MGWALVQAFKMARRASCAPHKRHKRTRQGRKRPRAGDKDGPAAAASDLPWRGEVTSEARRRLAIGFHADRWPLKPPSIMDHAARSGLQPAEVTKHDGANGPSRADTCVLAAALERGWRPAGDGQRMDGWSLAGQLFLPWLSRQCCQQILCVGAAELVLACAVRSACMCLCMFPRDEKETRMEAADDVINKGRARAQRLEETLKTRHAPSRALYSVNSCAGIKLRQRRASINMQMIAVL